MTQWRHRRNASQQNRAHNAYLAKIRRRSSKSQPTAIGEVVMLFVLIIIWFILSVVIGSAASQRGRDAFGWFLLSIFTSPLLAGVLLLLFPPLRDPILAVDDGALQQSIREGMLIEPMQKRGTGGLVFLLAIVGLLAFVGITIHNSNTSVQPSAETISPDSRGSAALTQSTNKNEYAAVASLPCTKYLSAYGTTKFSSLSEPLIATVNAREDGLGSGANIIDFVATECRLQEKLTIGQAVENLFNQKREHRLPRIPIGGASSDPEVHRIWDTFDKWIHHRAPRPDFNNTTVLAQTKSATSVGCQKDGDLITIQGIATAQSLELANGSTKSVWLLATDRPICVVESEDGIADPQERNVSRLQVVGKPPPTGVAIELKGKLSTGNITQYYAESTAIVVTGWRRIDPAPQVSESESASGVSALEWYQNRTATLGHASGPTNIANANRSLGSDGVDVNDPGWIKIESKGEVSAIVDTRSIQVDADGNAHALTCIVLHNACLKVFRHRWFYNCHDHTYTWIDTSILPGIPRNMHYAEPTSVADKLLIIACR
jgi:hypothetical protein